MSQPTTYLLDPTNPNEQTWPYHQPIYWTANRSYSFSQQVALNSTNHSLFYKSTDGGITWTEPDVANAPVVNGESDYFWDGSTNVCNVVFFPLSSGSQRLHLIDFDLNAETYSAEYGNVGAPSSTAFANLVKVLRTQDGSLVIFYHTIPGGGLTLALHCVIFAGGAWGVPFNPADNILGTYAQIETALVSGNTVYFFYTDDLGTFFYRTVDSSGTLGAANLIPPVFGGPALHIGNLNAGRCFGTGVIDAGATTITEPVLTRDPTTRVFSISVLTVTIAVPLFSLSPPIETALAATEGWEPAQAILSLTGSTYRLLYFTGDGLGNLYNLVRLSTNSGSGWSAPATIYDALSDSNAGQSVFSGQWINAISGTIDPAAGNQFQVATFLTLPNEPQNTATLTTAFNASIALGCGNPPSGQIGQAYSSTLAPSGGTAPYTFAIIAGALPPGLALNTATGVISGSPTTVGSFTFTAQVTDSLSATGTVVCSIPINLPLAPFMPLGGMGCFPHCEDPCLPTKTADLRIPNRGGDPAIALALLAALALLEAGELIP